MQPSEPIYEQMAPVPDRSIIIATESEDDNTVKNGSVEYTFS